MDQDRLVYIVVDRVGAPYRVLLYQPGIRFIHLSNSKGLCLQQGRNCYACREFGHMAHHCRNKGRERVMEERRVEYEGGRFEKNLEYSDNLKGVENLEFLD